VRVVRGAASDRSIAFAIAIRDEDDTGLEHMDLPELRVGHLRREHARELLARRAPDLVEPVALALADAAAGNPLTLVELPATLSPEQRSGVADLPIPLAPGARLQAAFARRVSALPDRARRALLVVALSEGDDQAAITAACDRAGTDVTQLTHAEAAGLVRIDQVA
jgi:hypothetical protein